MWWRGTRRCVDNNSDVAGGSEWERQRERRRKTGLRAPHVKWFAISLRCGESTQRVMKVPRKNPVSSADAVRV